MTRSSTGGRRPEGGPGTVADHVLPEKGVVGHHPHRHEAVRLRLELQNEVDGHRSLAVAPPEQTPDAVAVAVPQIGADEVAPQPLQGRKVELPHPGLAHEPSQQVGDDPRVSKEQPVSTVVFFHRASVWFSGLPVEIRKSARKSLIYFQGPPRGAARRGEGKVPSATPA